jgi:hypothetical protein
VSGVSLLLCAAGVATVRQALGAPSFTLRFARKAIVVPEIKINIQTRVPVVTVANRYYRLDLRYKEPV